MARWLNRNDRSEQAVFLVRRAGRKKQRSSQPVCAACAGAVTKLERPKAIDLNWPSRRGMQQTNGFELTLDCQRRRIKSVNATIPEVADK